MILILPFSSICRAFGNKEGSCNFSCLLLTLELSKRKPVKLNDQKKHERTPYEDDRWPWRMIGLHDPIVHRFLLTMATSQNNVGQGVPSVSETC